jgi:sugar (pentulose or hexulose) kinase
MPPHSYVLGIDVGTSGVKTTILRDDGEVAGRGGSALPAPVVRGDRREQDAQLWWTGTLEALHQALADLVKDGGKAAHIVSLSIDATSGTVVPVDDDLKPLRPGMMYNDARSREQAARLNDLGADTLRRLGYRFNASFGLPKVLWIAENEPDVMQKASCVLHQADFLAARLSGGSFKFTSDESNALKTGYDIVAHQWPGYLASARVDVAKLPAVRPIGETLGTVGKSAAEEFGLSRSCRIVAGMTDGTAACAASGARRIGDMNTTLGTTVVWKMLSSSLVADPKGRLYSHRHPGGAFLPGGAGNAGGEGLKVFLNPGSSSMEEHLGRLARRLAPGPPTGSATYPLPSPGERYPFVDPSFEAFTTQAGRDETTVYRSCLEGIACIERWGYEVARELGAESDGDIWTTGRGAYLDVWMQIRADFLNRPVCRAAVPESAFGSALVAAMNAWHGGSWQDTAKDLVRENFRCEPDRNHRQACEESYARFRQACEAKRSQKR